MRVRGDASPPRREVFGVMCSTRRDEDTEVRYAERYDVGQGDLEPYDGVAAPRITTSAG